MIRVVDDIEERAEIGSWSDTEIVIENVLTAAFDKNQERGPDGRWIDEDGVSFKPDIKAFPEKNHEQMLKQQESYTPAQVKAIKNYSTTEGYKSINGALRNSALKTLFLAGKIKMLRSIMRPTKENMSVFRNTKLDNFGVESVAELKKLIGKTFQDKGFVSTSVNRGGTLQGKGRNIHVIVEVPKGTPAAYIAGDSSAPFEQEMLLDAGTKFVIQEVIEAFDTIVHIRVVK